MKYIIAISLTFLLACNKKPFDYSGYTGVVNVIHAAPNLGDIKINFTGQPMNYSEYFDKRVNYYQYSPILQMENGLKTYAVAVNKTMPLTIVRAPDTLTTVFSRTMRFNELDIYTLYISGDSSSLDTIFVKEDFPVRTDSTAGIRFVNLCNNVGSISFNLAGEDIGSQVKTLAYKEITPFITYPARSENKSLLFEARKTDTGELLGTFEFGEFFRTIPRFRNATLILRGFYGGTGQEELQLVRVNNF